MSALIRMLLCSPWHVQVVDDAAVIIALDDVGFALGFVAVDMTREVAEHIVDTHNAELDIEHSCDLCSADRPGQVYVPRLGAWALAACGGSHE